MGGWEKEENGCWCGGIRRRGRIPEGPADFGRQQERGREKYLQIPTYLRWGRRLQVLERTDRQGAEGAAGRGVYPEGEI